MINASPKYSSCSSQIQYMIMGNNILEFRFWQATAGNTQQHHVLGVHCCWSTMAGWLAGRQTGICWFVREMQGSWSMRMPVGLY